MPVIEYNTDGEVFPLVTAPPDGFVKARPLSYDEMLTRRDLAAKFIYRQKDAVGKSASNGIGAKPNKTQEADDVEMMMESANSVVQRFQFSNQILDHNLEFSGGVRINFANPAHLKRVPPKLGTEIEKILDKLNQEEDEGDFPEQSTTSSVTEKTSSRGSKVSAA